MTRGPFHVLPPSAPSTTRDRPGLDTSAVSVKPGETAMRFAFGFGVSVVAAVIGKLAGPHVGGLFLAFPAILPAALTLLQKRDGRDPADADAWGAVAGALGMVGFAVVAALLLAGHPALGLLLGVVAWMVVSLSAWALLQLLLNQRR
jgi:hypothetical protein